MSNLNIDIDQDRNTFIAPKANNGIKPMPASKSLAGPRLPWAAFVVAVAAGVVELAPIVMLELAALVVPLDRAAEAVAEAVATIVIEESVAAVDMTIEESVAAVDMTIEESMDIWVRPLLAKRSAGMTAALNNMVADLCLMMGSRF